MSIRAACCVLASSLVFACNGGGIAVAENARASASTASGSVSAAASIAERAAPPAFQMSAAAKVGKRLFFEASLSASGKMSCATCHDPSHAYGPPNDLAVELGGKDGTSPGLRAVPSLRYTEYTPAYSNALDNPDGIAPPAPGGGFAWDGRADSLREQAKAPLLSPFEMANTGPADVVAKVRASAAADEFRSAFGERVFDDIDGAFDGVTRALEAFQTEDPSFHPYSSKFDLHALGKPGGEFTPAEERGFTLFKDTESANCVGCHLPVSGVGGSTTLFTDFSFEAIGVPRNPAIPANRARGYFDLGLCGPLRIDHPVVRGKPNEFCGMFKTPTLRNVATRHVFFHNGVIHTLEDAVRFYATRDAKPELWYPTRGGVVQKFDDLPSAHRGNVDRQLPLDGRAAGSPPSLDEQQIHDLVCFLETLTDDYAPGVTPTPARCVK